MSANNKIERDPRTGVILTDHLTRRSRRVVGLEATLKHVAHQ